MRNLPENTIRLALLVTSGLLTGCFQPPPGSGMSSATSSTTARATLTPAAGAMGVKIIFKDDSTGSFNTPSGAKVAAAVRLFDPSGAEMARGGPGSSGWPDWLTSVYVGISGPANANADDADCARFATAVDAGGMTCRFDIANPGTSHACGAPNRFYRVAEKECAESTVIRTGEGSDEDPVYIKATFSRDVTKLAAHENIMAVLEYSASAINPAPMDPTSCFSGGQFDPTEANCSDFSWQVYLRDNSVTSTLPKPFLMLIPPVFSHLRTAGASSQLTGTGVVTKQFLLPLASDSSLNTLQISRIKGHNAITYNGLTICGANSAACSGVIFYSLSLYRM